MQYFIAFIEGIITFISPCLLPMLPVYLSYFAGDRTGGRRRVMLNSLGFILGFATVFVLLGALAGSVGGALREHRTAVDLVTGLAVIAFGLSFLGVIRIPFLQGSRGGMKQVSGFFSSALFGIVFSLAWTPCVGAFLGSALMLAASQGHVPEGILMLFLYSLGLGIPLFFSALLIDGLKDAFSWIKRHYGVINRISGILLVVMGVLMATGLFGKWVAILS